MGHHVLSATVFTDIPSSATGKHDSAPRSFHAADHTSARIAAVMSAVIPLDEQARRIVSP